MPVIGGSGLFRFARGYVQARTHNFDPKTGDATVQYNVYIALFLSSIIGTINSHECAVVSKSISKISINIINNSSMTIWIQSTQKLKNTRAKLPPGPPGLPLIGNLHQLDATNLAFCFWKLSKQYGPIFSLRLGFRPTIVISSAKLAKEAFKTHDLQFSSRPALSGTQKLSYNFLGLTLTPHYNSWREMKKKFVTHILSANRTEQFRQSGPNTVAGNRMV
ncbi:hypothetical protein CUMW_269170 [Citrus unshiu]|uniref:Dirigent protein n=1 Tax=Citrus unshiu TaxID=55188 RepID=A0A2H5QWU4_CITUN|nr:hypothetical protein CUMW_269170 [Citrus unshiu]